MHQLTLAVFLLVILPFSTFARTPAPENAELYFISPEDGEILSNPITVRFGLKNMGIAPAGIQVQNTGHHHLLVNAKMPPLNLPIINDENHLHFGAGQTQTSITLPPGTHTLQLLLGDFAHIPHDPIVKSKQITITVK